MIAKVTWTLNFSIIPETSNQFWAWEKIMLKGSDWKSNWIVPTRWSWITEPPLVGQALSWVCCTLPSEMKFAEAIGAPLFNLNGWANTSLIQSEPFAKKCNSKIRLIFYLIQYCPLDMVPLFSQCLGTVWLWPRGDVGKLEGKSKLLGYTDGGNRNFLGMLIRGGFFFANPPGHN